MKRALMVGCAFWLGSSACRPVEVSPPGELPPDVELRVLTRPDALSNRRDAEVTFRFSAPDGVRLTCALDGAALDPCASPLVLAALAEGAHALRFTAVEVDGRPAALPS